jgi:hypothetical protein
MYSASFKLCTDHPRPQAATQITLTISYFFVDLLPKTSSGSFYVCSADCLSCRLPTVKLSFGLTLGCLVRQSYSSAPVTKIAAKRRVRRCRFKDMQIPWISLAVYMHVIYAHKPLSGAISIFHSFSEGTSRTSMNSIVSRCRDGKLCSVPHCLGFSPKACYQ